MKSSFVNSTQVDKNDILAAASASFFGVFNLGLNFSHTSADKVMDQYLNSRTESHISTFGGPIFRLVNARCNKCVFHVFSLLHQGYRYHKVRKAFSKFYRRHYELVSIFKVGLKSVLQQGLSEPEFYGDLVYKLRKIVCTDDFSDQFRKVIMRYKRIGYNINVIQQSACLAINPVTVYSFASFIYCTPVGRASDSMMAQHKGVDRKTLRN